MERKLINKFKKGITVIELMVVIAIMAIMLALALPPYNNWRKKQNIEEDVRKILALLQQYRVKAFSEKVSFSFSFPSSKTFVVKDSSNNIVESINLKNQFDTSKNSSVDKRGTFSSNSFLMNPADNIGVYNCIVINNIRATLGKYDGSKCEAK